MKINKSIIDKLILVAFSLITFGMAYVLKAIISEAIRDSLKE
jgi:hypothetical protein